MFISELFSNYAKPIQLQTKVKPIAESSNQTKRQQQPQQPKKPRINTQA